MRMNAIPVFAGIALRSSVNASRPPAEAPIPTMGNGGRLVRAGCGGARRRLSDRDDFALKWPMGPPRFTLEAGAPSVGPPHTRWDPRNLPYARQRPACQRQGGLYYPREGKRGGART